MKQERILYALEHVLDEYIMESAPAGEKRIAEQWKNRKWLVFLSAAAVLLILTGMIYRMQQRKQHTASEMAVAEQAESELQQEPAEVETGDDMGGLTEVSSSADERFVDIKDLLALAGSEQAVVAEEVQRMLRVPVGGYTAIYEGVGTDGGEEFREKLFASKGALYPEGEGLYYVSGHTDRQYLIRTEGEDVSLWKFACFDAAGYPFRDVLTEIYNTHSGEGFAELIVTAGNMDNTEEGLRIQQEIGTRRVTDRDSLNGLYRILSGMICVGPDRWDLIQTDSQDADVSGTMTDAHQEVRLTRYLTIVTPYIEIDSLKYTAASGMFYEFGGVAYEPLSAEDAEMMRELLEIGTNSDETHETETTGNGVTKRVAYSHGGTELSLTLPVGWSHRICSADECAEMDGMMRFGISFWPEENSGIELSYGCYDNAGMCGTGVTIEELTLDSGIRAWKYTEEYTQEHKMWMSVILEPDGWTPQDGSCMMECHIDLDQWLAYEDAIMGIVKTLDVSG